MRLLIGLGKLAIVLAALAMVIGGAVGGWAEASQEPVAGLSGTAAGIVGAIIGLIGGLITAGAIFGLAAALFEIERSLRRIADASVLVAPAPLSRGPVA